MFIHLIWIYEKHEMLVFHTDLHLPLNFTYWGKQEENKTKINKWIHKWTIHICDYRRKEMYFPVWKYFTLSIWNPKGCINIGIISIYNLYRNMCSWGHLFRLVYHSCFFKRNILLLIQWSRNIKEPKATCHKFLEITLFPNGCFHWFGPSWYVLLW